MADLRALSRRFAHAAYQLARTTTFSVLDHRTSGLAAEVAFFSLFALPPALLALFGAIGFVGRILGEDVIQKVELLLLDHSRQFLTEGVIREIVEPTISTLLRTERVDLFSLGVLFALWSTSRAADALLSALHVSYGLGDVMPIWRRRGRAMLYTTVATLWGGVLLPLLVAGPNLGRAFAGHWGFTGTFDAVWSASYWPTVSAVAVLTLTCVYHFAHPVRTPFLRDLPGALFAMLLWVAGSVALRAYAHWTIQESPIYGSLASPMIVLMWLYFTSFSVLMGAELNAAIETLYPTTRATSSKPPEPTTDTSGVAAEVVEAPSSGRRPTAEE